MTDTLRAPYTTWEYCLSAAEEMVLWHHTLRAPVADEDSEADDAQTVALLAAALHGKGGQARGQ
ncbi:hypothetical protein AB0I22_33070 [Streptomyces sp. NPDC050610]|uniref:hypothetical protein n=1 Tax=Streptomyces sp. NPDC050610 TaxID=3157097 RepID=UPI0034241FC1